MREIRTAHTSNFVAPYREPPAQVVEVETWRELPSAQITPPMPHSNHTDRAKGFGIVVGPLAAATGLVVLLIGISAFGVPVLSVAALLLALGGFSLTWLAAYLAHTFVSSEGALVIHVVMGWQYLRREQRERHKRYGLRTKGRE